MSILMVQVLLRSIEGWGVQKRFLLFFVFVWLDLETAWLRLRSFVVAWAQLPILTLHSQAGVPKALV